MDGSFVLLRLVVIFHCLGRSDPGGMVGPSYNVGIFLISCPALLLSILHPLYLIFFCLFVLLHSCCSHQRIFEKPLVHEFHISYSQTEWYCLYFRQCDLGITKTRDLKWQKQAEKSCKTANRVLGFIARNFNYKSTELMLPLYKSFVQPHLEYAVQFWSPHLRRDIDKMERVQRKATKMIPEIRNHGY